MRKIHFLLLIINLVVVFCCAADLNQGILNLVSYSKKAGVGYRVYVEDGYAYITNNTGVVIFELKHDQRH